GRYAYAGVRGRRRGRGRGRPGPRVRAVLHHAAGGVGPPRPWPFVCSRGRRASGGRLDVASEAGAGATFTVTLPGSACAPGSAGRLPTGAPGDADADVHRRGGERLGVREGEGGEQGRDATGEGKGGIEEVEQAPFN